MTFRSPTLLAKAGNQNSRGWQLDMDRMARHNFPRKPSHSIPNNLHDRHVTDGIFRSPSLLRNAGYK